MAEHNKALVHLQLFGADADVLEELERLHPYAARTVLTREAFRRGAQQLLEERKSGS